MAAVWELSHKFAFLPDPVLTHVPIGVLQAGGGHEAESREKRSVCGIHGWVSVPRVYPESPKIYLVLGLGPHRDLADLRNRWKGYRDLCSRDITLTCCRNPTPGRG